MVRLRSDDACSPRQILSLSSEGKLRPLYKPARNSCAKMIPESAARRIACLAGHISRQGEQGQDATSLTQQVGVNLPLAKRKDFIWGSLYSILSVRLVHAKCAGLCGQAHPALRPGMLIH